MSEEQDTYKKELQTKVLKCKSLAEWIYADVFYNCDNLANVRTAERLRGINAQHGKDALFGISGAWAYKAFWAMGNAMQKRPDLVPKNLDEILASDTEDGQKRAVIGAQQFISTMTHDNPETAYALFSAAYDAGVDEFVALMWSILMFTLRIVAEAKKIGEK